MLKVFTFLMLMATSAIADPLINSKNLETEKYSCTNDVAVTIKSLKEDGFKSLIDLKDVKPDVMHQIAFDMNTNRVLALTIYHEKNNIGKVCIDFIGITPLGHSDAFRNFLINQQNDVNEFFKNQQKSPKQENNP